MTVLIIGTLADVKIVSNFSLISTFLKEEKNPLIFASLLLMRLVHWELIYCYY